MDSPESEHQADHSALCGDLLLAYLDSNREESRFAALVDHLGGLVFHSALRRTGNRVLAEDVTQTVFALLARKGASLRSHPNLTAWVFRTTQLESAKAMRSEKRHQRKLDAFASEHPAAATPDGSAAAWQEALPALDASLDELPSKDRALLIQRFFEKKKFSEIAASTDRSEAACKMQLKRALEKLALLLRARGVALSVPVIATGLSAEFAKAAPLATSTLATQSLAASTGITTSTVLTNTLLTMSTAKSSALTTAAVVVIGLFPLIHQQSEAAKLRAEIDTLEKTTLSQSPTRPTTSDTRSPRTLRERLNSTRQPIEAGSLLGDLMKVTMEQDIVGLIRILTPIAAMTPTEYAKLMEEIEAHDASPEAKSNALMMLASFAPETDFRQEIETLIRQGTAPEILAEPIRRWAGTDPDAALAWFQTARANGELLGKGIQSDPTPRLYADILVAIAASQPARALELAASMPENERSEYSIDARLTATLRSSHLAELQAAETIADPNLKSTTRQRIADSWIKLSPADARKNLPADLLPQQDN